MRLMLDALTSSKTLWLLTLIALIAVYNPQAVHASENVNKNEKMVFSGIEGTDAVVLSAQSSTLQTSMIPETPARKPQQQYSITKTKTATVAKNAPVVTKNTPKSTPTTTSGTRTVTLSSYTSSPEETMGNPFITASGAHVHMGTAAWNGMPFGTKFKIPELSGDLVYTVEDRGSMGVMGTHTIDLWRPTKAEAYAIGRRQATIEFVE